jgi:phage terminase Nu1 subunit (DNA packaging protein)
MSLYDALWSSPTRKTVTSMAAMISAIMGVIVGLNPAVEAWDANGMPTMATRGWARMQLTQFNDLSVALRATRIDIANGKKESAERDLNKLELDVLKAGSEEEKVKNLQNQRQVKDTIENLKRQIHTLEKGH